MDIDVLTYQLKYKRDQDVLDLLEAYQTSESFLQCEYDNDSKKSDQIDTLERQQKKIIESCAQLARDLEDALEELDNCQNLKKKEILDYIKDAKGMIENVVSDLHSME